VTFTAKLHDAPASKVAPAKLRLVALAVAVIVPPPQVPVRPLGVDTASPLGKVSVNPIPLSARLLLGLERLKVRVVLPFNATPAAPNAFAMVGGSFVGGGGVVLELPPPQPTFARKLRVMQNKKDAERESAPSLLAIF